MSNLSNSTISTSVSPENGRFTIEISTPEASVVLENACLGVRYRYRGRTYRNLYDHWNVSLEDRFESKDDHLGKLHQHSLLIAPDEHGISYQLTFALPERYPFLIWKLLIRNNGEQSVWIDQIDMLRVGEKAQPKGPLTGRLAFENSSPETELAFYSNGWQSWSYTATYGESDVQRRTRLGSIQSVINNNHGTTQPHSPGHFSGDLFGVIGDRVHGNGLLIGFLSQEQHFGSVETWLKKSFSVALWANGDGTRLDPREVIETDWAVIQGFSLRQPDPLVHYFDAAASQNEVQLREDIPVGWCSWYQYYQKVTAENIRQNLRTVSNYKNQIPLKIIQIDDGFESQIGDWFDFRNTFPNGVADLSAEIHRNGFESGLWLAPFIVHPKSKLIKEHPDYILRNRNGRPVNAGFIWNVFTTALDLTHPGAMDYAWCVVEKAVREWGFSYLKLDFLYAAGLPGHHKDPTKTRAQVLRNGLKALRKAVGPDTFLLGCGLPLGSGIGIVDAMRISADVSGNWTPSYMGVKPFFKKEPHIPSAQNSIQNGMTRAMFHNRWWINDPDCLLVRVATDLTQPEIQSLATTIALTGGSLLLSDSLPELPEDRVQLVQKLLPVIGKRATVVDWFDRESPEKLRVDMSGPVGDWYLLALFNWEDKEKETTFDPGDFGVPQKEYWLTSFWDGAVRDSSKAFTQMIPAHGVTLWAVREKLPTQPQYLGSDIHISQGMEVSDWTVGEGNAVCQIRLNRLFEGTLLFYSPVKPKRILFQGIPIFWKMIGEKITQVSIRGDKTGELSIEF